MILRWIDCIMCLKLPLYQQYSRQNIECHMLYVLSICLSRILLPKMHHVFANILHNISQIM